MMWGYPGDGFGWWWLMGGIWMILFWGAIIALVIWIVRQLTGHRPAGGSPPETPLEIAQKRLARGELSREEFDRIREALGDQTTRQR